MKVFAVAQPWATLIALGEQRFYATAAPLADVEPGTKLAIYAQPQPDHGDHLTIARNQPIATILDVYDQTYETLKFGAIVGTVEVKEIHHHADVATSIDRVQRKLIARSYDAPYLYVLNGAEPLDKPVPFKEAPAEWDAPKPPTKKQTEAASEPLDSQG